MSLTGTIKIFNPVKGFGFITTPEGTDVFCHLRECNTTETSGCPVAGDTVTYDLTESTLKPGQMHASNVTGGSGAPPKKGGGAVFGTVKSFNPDKGWGFIATSQGEYVFFHMKAMSDRSMPQAGDNVQFDLEESRVKPGQKNAINITGGTAGKGGGKGKDGGKGGWDAWGGKGDSWGGDGYGAAKGGWGGDAGWGAAPYGGGKGKDSWGGKGGDSWGGKGGDSWGAPAGKGGKGGDSWGAPAGKGGDAWGAAPAGGASWGAGGW